MTKTLPALRLVMSGRTAASSRGRGSTSAANTSLHSVSVTSTAAVVGAVKARLTTRMSICPASRTILAAASGAVSRSELLTTSAPCSVKTWQRTGPMNSVDWVTRIRLPVSACCIVILRVFAGGELEEVNSGAYWAGSATVIGD